MKRIYELVDLDCANCAAKMEDAIAEIEGVENVSVSFIMQKLTIEAPDDKIDAIIKKAVKICKKIEPDCTILLK